tara:strand:+ start:2206 stop:2997 length:792 start_codon:yes stop_codon:yes gene_type:complete
MFKAALKIIAMSVCFFVAKMLRVQRKPAILMYHSFDREAWQYGVHPDALCKQIHYLMQRHQIVPLADIVSHAKGTKEISKGSVALTVDDGYLDTYTEFFPLAKKYDIPFTLFLTTDLSSSESLGNLPRPSVVQLQEMFDSGLMEMGLHGHTHTHFTEVFDNQAINAEIRQSEDFIYLHFGVRTKCVAYPSGRRSKDIVEYFQNVAGYDAGLAITSGFVSQGDNVFALKRVEVSRNVPTLLLFKLRLTPALVVYNALIKKIWKV